ncbi:hypothetical protein Vadar_023597 [Vaccinium darrowii]|uniref:Uncharacterized protein n=1 Tax=Vaccinium darrowii TaxID=229202 RepID=A0ACB7X3M3_9ERIC|nr:hypothetical protein Vadar_023597 [Vaccinium darrowii]
MYLLRSVVALIFACWNLFVDVASKLLFNSIERYDDGAYYFDEKVVDAREYQGPLSVTSFVVRGLTAVASATSGSLNLPGDKLPFLVTISEMELMKN